MTDLAARTEPVVPVALERSLAELGIIVAAASEPRPAIVLPFDVALLVLQEVNGTEKRRYVTAEDRLLLQRSVNAVRFP